MKSEDESDKNEAKPSHSTFLKPEMDEYNLIENRINQNRRYRLVPLAQEEFVKLVELR